MLKSDSLFWHLYDLKEMNEVSFTSIEPKVYRLTWVYRLYHFAVAAAALAAAIKVRDFLSFAIVLALFSVFMISRALVMAVTVDQFSVAFKTLFSETALQRSSVTAVETRHSGKGSLLILWGNIDEKEQLVIPCLFAFDEDWDRWISTLRDLSDDKPLTLF